VGVEALPTSVPEPWHFCVDPVPDPQIHASDKWIRILLFSSLTFKMPTKNNLKLFEGTFTSFFKIKNPKEVTKQ
jgi:hypothetical protein